MSVRTDAQSMTHGAFCTAYGGRVSFAHYLMCKGNLQVAANAQSLGTFAATVKGPVRLGTKLILSTR